MSTTKKPEDLTKGTSKNAPELSESELTKVSGGASDTLLKIDGIKGESTDTSHKSEIEILSFAKHK